MRDKNNAARTSLTHQPLCCSLHFRRAHTGFSHAAILQTAAPIQTSSSNPHQPTLSHNLPQVLLADGRRPRRDVAVLQRPWVGTDGCSRRHRSVAIRFPAASQPLNDERCGARASFVVRQPGRPRLSNYEAPCANSTEHQLLAIGALVCHVMTATQDGAVNLRP